MEITEVNVRVYNCSCSFCDKGVLSANGNNIKYPYKTVYKMVGERGTLVYSCIECLSEIFSKVKFNLI